MQLTLNLNFESALRPIRWAAAENENTVETRWLNRLHFHLMSAGLAPKSKWIFEYDPSQMIIWKWQNPEVAKLRSAFFTVCWYYADILSISFGYQRWFPWSQPWFRQFKKSKSAYFLVQKKISSEFERFEERLESRQKPAEKQSRQRMENSILKNNKIGKNRSLIYQMQIIRAGASRAFARRCCPICGGKRSLRSC